MTRIFSKIFESVLLIAFSLTFTFFPQPIFSAALKTGAPKRANIFLAWRLTPEEAVDLSRWDLLILDMEVGARQPELIKDIRTRNPNIIILAYISSQEIRKDAGVISSYAPLRAKLANRLSENWYLNSSSGEKVSFWPTAWMLDVTSAWNEALPQFIHEEIASTGLWDGVMLDNIWDSVVGHVGNQINLAAGGGSPNQIDAAWQQGVHTLLKNIRNRDASILLLGNGSTNYPELNGSLIENFQNFNWGAQLTAAARSQKNNQSPGFVLINATANNLQTPDDFKSMRYGLASTLLVDGYYAFDFGDQLHESRWWYDEYNTNLGKPIGSAANTKTLATNFNSAGVWRRDFSSGTVLVNSSSETQDLDLQTDFETLHGTQDNTQNTGRVISEISLADHDGIILLKPLEKMAHSGFLNGAFVRVWNPDGTTKRNGFFTYTPEARGSNTVLPFDFSENNEPQNYIIADANSIKFYNRATQNIIWQVVPNGEKYRSGFSLTRITTPNGPAIAATPLAGKPWLKIFAADGKILATTKIFSGRGSGATVATLSNNSVSSDDLVLGSGSGLAAKIITTDWRGTPRAKKEFAPFAKNMTTGIWLATGDIDNDGTAEIIAIPRAGRRPEIKIFSLAGKQKKSFIAPSQNERDSVMIATDDLDNDGTPELLTLHRNVFATAGAGLHVSARESRPPATPNNAQQ